ncbi:MAG: MATE family efflux transporter [Lachnospiraceae bacterium]|nr:MATE family efflux transporter [Lachnospiraceae bacterium]
MEKVKKKKYEIDMCNGSIFKKLLLFSIPLMCSGMLQLLFNAADIVVVGNFAGDNSLSAVGATSSLINLLTNVFIGLSVGANVLAARFAGSGSKDEIHKTVHTSIAVALISGLFLTVVGLVGAPIILRKMETPEGILPLAVLYLRIYFLGMPANMVYNFGSALLRAVGDTKRPLYYLTFAGIVNVVFNLIFVIVFKMDVAGVAVATVISQCISAVLVVRCLMKEEGSIRLDLKSVRIHGKTFLKLLQVGLPAGVQGTLFSLSNVFIQSSVNLFGDITVGGNSIASNLEGFVYVAMHSVYQGTISFVSQNVGAGKFERVNKIVWTSQALVFMVGTGLGNLVFLLGRPLLGLYTDTPEVIEAGMTRLTFICTIYALCGMMDVMVGAMRGIGYSVLPMIVSLLGACAFRLVWLATVFQIENLHIIETVYISYPVSWTLTLLAHIVCFVIVRKKVGKEWAKLAEKTPA